jgi:hypothetical protein
MKIKNVIQTIKDRHNLSVNDEVGLIGTINTKSTVDRANRHIFATATSNFVDLTDEVVVQDGIDWSYLDANRKILVDHVNSVDTLVGTLVNRKAVTKIINQKLVTQRWDILVHVLPLEKNKYCDDILTIAEHAGIGMSIGFQVLEKGTPTKEEMALYNGGKPFSSIIRKAKILEVSFVACPCNVEAQSMDVQASKRKAAIAELANKQMIDEHTANLLGVKQPTSEVKNASSVDKEIENRVKQAKKIIIFK